MRRQKERIFNLPPVILWIVVLLVAIEGFSQLIAPETYLEILQHFAFVPGRFTFAFDPARVTAAFNAIPEDAEFRAQEARFFLGDGKPLWWTPLTYAFLHGGWLHVGMNCLWFVAFGSPVARRFGAPRFLFFCAVAAVAGAAMHYVTHIADLQPYIDKQSEVDLAYRDRNSWLKKSLLNIARMGKFSSDRTIREYARDIWGIRPAVIGNFAHAALEDE